jgi:cytochrome oxidase assembly protein ShyY1
MKVWVRLDVDAMAAQTHCEPLLIEEIMSDDYTRSESAGDADPLPFSLDRYLAPHIGPVEHARYAGTWFALCGALLWMRSKFPMK